MNLKVLSLIGRWKTLFPLFLFLASPVYAIDPFTLTLYGVYGSPVLPSGLTATTRDGLGFNALAEWNPGPNASVGLGFEYVNFLSVPDFAPAMINVEGKLFPFENGTKKFSPYLYGGGGINLSGPASWQGPFQLKAGLGTRVAFLAGLYIDLAVGSHWILDPGGVQPADFQYVDARAGLSFSFDFTKQATSHDNSRDNQKAPKPKEAPKQEPAAQTQAQPVAKAEPPATPVPSSNPITDVIAAVPQPAKKAPVKLEIEMVDVNQAPTPTAVPTEQPQVIIAMETVPTPTAHEAASSMMKYYRIGARAYLKQDYLKALKYLRKSAKVVDPEVRPVFYSEANALAGVVYYVQSKPKLAKSYLLKALKLNPANPAAKKYLKKLKKGAKKKVVKQAPAETI